MENLISFIVNVLIIGLGYFLVYKAFSIKLKKLNIKTKILNEIELDIICEYSDSDQEENTN